MLIRYTLSNIFICIPYDVYRMTQSYVKPCLYCKKEIEMSDRAAGHWLPYNIEDGNLHSCGNQEAKIKTTHRAAKGDKVCKFVIREKKEEYL